MSESTRIQAEKDCRVYVDEWEDGWVWLSIQTNHGGTHCIIPQEQVKEMIAALQAAIGEQV